MCSLEFLSWRDQLEMRYWTRTVSLSMKTSPGTKLMVDLSKSVTSRSTVHSWVKCKGVSAISKYFFPIFTQYNIHKLAPSSESDNFVSEYLCVKRIKL